MAWYINKGKNAVPLPVFGSYIICGSKSFSSPIARTSAGLLLPLRLSYANLKMSLSWSLVPLTKKPFFLGWSVTIAFIFFAIFNISLIKELSLTFLTNTVPFAISTTVFATSLPTVTGKVLSPNLNSFLPCFFAWEAAATKSDTSSGKILVDILNLSFVWLYLWF